MTMRTVALATALFLAAGCGSVTEPGPDAAGSVAATPTPTRTVLPVPTQIPDSSGLVRSRGIPTVLARGDEPPQLCLGAVAESLPPQCGGPVIEGWDWADYVGHYDEASGVRWSGVQVSGRLVDGRFVLRHAWVNNKYGISDGGLQVAPRPPCPEPDGGWRPVDTTKVSEEAMSATVEAAAALPGYGEAWVGYERNPALGSGDAGSVPVLVVRVTEDLEGAEATLRETWSGALCVARALRTAAELEGIQRQLGELPGMLGSSIEQGVVEAEVVYDDGSLQAWADASYGPEVVEISSALVPESD